MSLMENTKNRRDCGAFTVFRDAEGKDMFVRTSELDERDLAIFEDPVELSSFRRGLEDFADGRLVSIDL